MTDTESDTHDENDSRVRPKTGSGDDGDNNDNSDNNYRKLTLHPWQQEFLQKADDARKAGKTKALLILATGMGKTISAIADAVRCTIQGGKR